MDRSEIDQLAQRLLADPHDEEALQYAYQAGESDPKSYAFMLEKVGTETPDPVYASHWLSEAANIWSTVFSDVHRAARLLMMAIDKDPTSQTAAERLAQLYRDKGDTKALVALLDRRAKALSPLAAQNPDVRSELAGMYEEMGHLWSEAPLSQPKKAIECFRRAMDLDPTSAYAIYNARELLKATGQWREAVPLYDAELAVEQDPQRKIALLRDQAATCKAAGDPLGASRALSHALEIDQQDPSLRQEYASVVLDRIQSGQPVSTEERDHAADLLVTLAETYEGEHGLAYASAALDVSPGHDRAMQLCMYYARALGQEAELPQRLAGYLAASPGGALAREVREAMAAQRLDEPATANSLEGMVGGPGSPRQEVVDLVRPSASGYDAADRPSPARAPQEAERPRASRESARGVAARAQPPPDSSPEPDSGIDEVPRRAMLSPDRLQGILDAAQMLAGKGKRPEALVKYKEVLESDPAHPEALSWVEDYLRSKRDYGQLRDVLVAAVRAPSSQESSDSKKERLREIAGLCEGNLRDTDAAISAWKQLLSIDRTDESARTALTRLLERSQRWDDLANMLEQEATVESDIDTKISLEKKLAKLQEDKRKDLLAAGDAWARIARLVPEDEFAIQNAAKLYERGERADLAVAIIDEMAPLLEDHAARGPLLQRLAELKEVQGDLLGAGDSYAEAADCMRNGRLWEEAERLYVSAEKWAKAANAATQRGTLTSDAKQQAQYLFRAADYLTKTGNHEASLAALEDATDLDPLNDDYANAVVGRYQQLDQVDKLVAFLTKRGDRLVDKAKRVHTRREAASLSSSRLSDRELARELWLKVLEDGDDKEALERLIDDAVEAEDHTEAATLLRRLGANTVDKAEKARVLLREAELLAEGVGDVETAIHRYESILGELDPTYRPALQAIADLQEARDHLAEAADALERELKLVADVQERGAIAGRLARLYESEKLSDPRSAIRALDLVRKASLDDFDALARLCELCEQTEQWTRVAELLVERIEVEADDDEICLLTMKLAGILSDKLDRGDEALAALTELADAGDSRVRDAYIELGDRLGWKGIVASKLVDWWFEARHGADRTNALRNAFNRFVEVGRDQDAVKVGIELVRTKTADRKLADHLEELAVKTGDQDALIIAHDLLAREVSGPDRAHELVRQAEIRVKAGMPRGDALQHGEQGLASIAPADAEPLLERVAALATKPVEVVDLYERQVSRSKAPPDRLRALARAAQVASQRGQLDRGRGFFELALSGAPTEDTLNVLETAARDGDKTAGGDRLRRALTGAMGAGGHGARDGGRTRGMLLRKAAQMAHQELNDVDQAFSWLGDALVANVDQATLDALERLGDAVSDPGRAEAALTHALNEVFDGPLVRQLLARRARIRRDRIRDLSGAAVDLKKLHDLSPTDHAVMEELSGLLTELRDFRTLVQLYEDQILRGKDMAARAELARKVARMWEEQLQDAREAADAWRRVLRMKAGDVEATEGLDRAKTNQLKTADPESLHEAYAPPRPSAPPPPQPSASPGRMKTTPSAIAPPLGSRSTAGPPSAPRVAVVASRPPPPATGLPPVPGSPLAPPGRAPGRAPPPPPPPRAGIAARLTPPPPAYSHAPNVALTPPPPASASITSTVISSTVAIDRLDSTLASQGVMSSPTVVEAAPETALPSTANREGAPVAATPDAPPVEPSIALAAEIDRSLDALESPGADEDAEPPAMDDEDTGVSASPADQEGPTRVGNVAEIFRTHSRLLRDAADTLGLDSPPDANPPDAMPETRADPGGQAVLAEEMLGTTNEDPAADDLHDEIGIDDIEEIHAAHTDATLAASGIVDHDVVVVDDLAEDVEDDEKPSAEPEDDNTSKSVRPFPRR